VSMTGQVIGRLAVATVLLLSAYLVMYGLTGLPWIISTGLHLYAIAALGVAALLIYQASNRALSAARR